MLNAPLVRRIAGAPDPLELLDRTADRPWTLWLDTAGPEPGGAGSGRSYFACDPFRVLRGRGGRSEWLVPGGREEGAADPLAELAGALERWRIAAPPGTPPFAGGAAGFLGYELAGDLERVPGAALRDLPLPDVEVGLYDVVVSWDRHTGSCWITSSGLPHAGEEGRVRAAARAARFESWLAGGSPPDEHRLGEPALDLPITERPQTRPVPGTGVRSTFTPAAYRKAVRRAIELIRAGDIYQVNLSQRFEAPAPADPAALYRRLRRASPAPYGAYFRASECVVLSSSPERFLRVTRDGTVETRPIKGTRPRHEDPTHDARLAAELARSVKDRSENLMIVDLLRNDLSRVCQPGSVKATELFRVESYATVHHLVSTVTGRLREGRRRTDLLRAAFPSGSVTGAPRIRAMEIIAELEPVTRGPYCGAIGYLGFGGDMDTSVSIRIAVVGRGRVVFHAGGAVVADSDPAAEYAETLDKARALIAAIEGEAP